MKRSGESPYLADTRRLGDVVAALQAAGTYKFYQLPFDGKGWSYRITGTADHAAHFRNVFHDHQEFFRIDQSGKGSLLWRRQHQKLYHVDRATEISAEEYVGLGEREKGRVSRSPLTPLELTALINTAIELHARAVAHQAARRWRITTALTVTSGALGVLAGTQVF